MSNRSKRAALTVDWRPYRLTGEHPPTDAAAWERLHRAGYDRSAYMLMWHDSDRTAAFKHVNTRAYMRL